MASLMVCPAAEGDHCLAGSYTGDAGSLSCGICPAGETSSRRLHRLSELTSISAGDACLVRLVKLSRAMHVKVHLLPPSVTLGKSTAPT